RCRFGRCRRQTDEPTRQHCRPTGGPGMNHVEIPTVAMTPTMAPTGARDDPQGLPPLFSMPHLGVELQASEAPPAGARGVTAMSRDPGALPAATPAAEVDVDAAL